MYRCIQLAYVLALLLLVGILALKYLYLCASLLHFNTAPCHSLDQRPTMKSLDEKVVVHVAGKWETTGLHLDIEDCVLRAIKTPNGTNEEHCREMLRRWLYGERGCGALARTWSSLLHAVEIGCGSEVRQKIAELLGL